MQIRVDRLREALDLLQPVVPRKTSLPIVQSVLLKDGKAIATNLEQMVLLDLPEAEGECLIPHRQVKALLKYVPGDEMLSIEQEAKTIRLSWDSGKAVYESRSPKEYPPVTELKEKSRGSIDGDRLVPAMMSIAGYCSTDQARPVLSGVSLSLGETIELAAGDGFRMAYQILALPFSAEERITIPANSIRIIGDLWKKAPPPVPLGDSIVGQVMAKRQLELTVGNVLSVRFGRVTLLTQLIEGTAPNFSQLIPKEPPITIRVFAPDLERAVRRCAEVAANNKGIICFNWTETAMTVSTNDGGDLGVEAEVRAQIEGGAGRVAANVKYFLDYLKGKDGLVSIGVTSPTSPILFRHGTSPLVVVMPMFVEDPAKAKPEPEPEVESEPVPEPEAEPEVKAEVKVKVKTRAKAKPK